MWAVEPSVRGRYVSSLLIVDRRRCERAAVLCLRIQRAALSPYAQNVQIAPLSFNEWQDDEW